MVLVWVLCCALIPCSMLLNAAVVQWVSAVSVLELG